MTDRDKVTIVINDLMLYKTDKDIKKTIDWILKFANQVNQGQSLPIDNVSNRVSYCRKYEEEALENGVLDSVSESSWAYYEKELDKIEQLNQTQSSLHKQMFILRHFANKLGLYDVADYLKR